MKTRLALFVVFASALSFVLGACGTGSSSSSSDKATGGGKAAAIQGGPGVDVATKTITIGDIGALTGPAAALGAEVSAGHEAYFKALNARGGIDGWKVKLVTKDSGYQPQQHV